MKIPVTVNRAAAAGLTNTKNINILLMFFVIILPGLYGCEIDDSLSHDGKPGQSLNEISDVCDPAAWIDTAFIDTLVSHSGTQSAGYGFENMSGPPHGKGEYQGNLDVFIIGEEEQAVFELAGRLITDGPGEDFRVFENAFRIMNSADRPEYFIDAAYVEISTDGLFWQRFDYSWDESADGFTTANLAGKSGLAGLYPTIYNCEHYEVADQADLKTQNAGGTGFDIAELGLEEIRYIRVVDSGSLLDGQPASLSNGVDLDSIAVFHYRDR